MTRRVRRAVLRFSSCLDDISSLQRRVLLLRAGLGAGPARSRRSVARKLDIRPRRVMRLERRGLRRVRALVRGGVCGAGDGGTGVPSGGAAAGAGGARGGGGSAILASADGASGSAGAGDTSAGSGSTTGSGSDGGESGGVRGESDSRPPELFSTGGAGSGSSAVPGGTPIAIALALVLLAALAGFAAPQVGRRVRSG
ncbi:MAG TPA: hypothetical protein VFP78_14215 [Solirubrobacteraceae bacterium]|nr:hypothetical protein [Solirubrobacteraceae bacterium]